MRRDQGSYLRDPAAIYRESFAAISREVLLDRLPEDLGPLVLRLIHACGMPDIVADLAWTPDAVSAGRAALRVGAPILVDATMVQAGIRSRQSAANPILCTLNDDATAARAVANTTTRSAAAVDGWRERLDGAVVAIGNAPTALFRLLELLTDGAARPAVVLGFPVGFVGAAEAKEALISYRPLLPHVTLRGRRGGSAMAAAALNALLDDDPLRGAQ
jgi:precorrin-8X/cobalt-precorrin-8 methylmutase